MPVVDVSEADFNRDIGSRIRGAREQASLTQQELALAAGLSRGSIANIERGEQAPPPYRLAVLASALAVTVHDLIPSLDLVRPRNTTERLPPSQAAAVARIKEVAARRRSVRRG